MRARDCGFEVVYQGIRLTPAQIVAAAVEEDVHVVGLSILSGSHMEAVPAVLQGLREAGATDVPVVVGGIIPDADAAALLAQGVAAVFTPKDFELTDILREVARGRADGARPARAPGSVAAAAPSAGRAARVAGRGRERAADLRVARRHPPSDELEHAADERQQDGEQRPRAQAAGEEGPDHGPLVPRPAAGSSPQGARAADPHVDAG